jgi:Zn ribbon nucleic-acid-binding protein
MYRYKNPHSQPADAVQYKGEHWSLSFVPQAGGQADIPIKAHLCLLGKMMWCACICYIVGATVPNCQSVFFLAKWVARTNKWREAGFCDYHTDRKHEKVTIILVISFQTSSKKAVIDPYNPNCWIVEKSPYYSNRNFHL